MRGIGFEMGVAGVLLLALAGAGGCSTEYWFPGMNWENARPEWNNSTPGNCAHQARMMCSSSGGVENATYYDRCYSGYVSRCSTMPVAGDCDDPEEVGCGSSKVDAPGS